MSENPMTVIGLCGRSGTGKGYVCEVFAARGIPFINTDRVYRELTKGIDKKPSPCTAALAHAFGNAVIAPDGSLDRRKLAALVFAEGGTEKLKLLNDISHRYILKETERKIEELAASGVSAVLIDAPVLFESGFDRFCDHLFCVNAPHELSVERICARDGISPADAEKRLESQLPEDELMKRCEEVIINDGFADVEAQVDEIMDKYGF